MPTLFKKRPYQEYYHYGITAEQLQKALLLKQRDLEKSPMADKFSQALMSDLSHMAWEYGLRQQLALGERQEAFKKMPDAKVVEVFEEFYLDKKSAQAMLKEESDGFVVRYSSSKKTFVASAFDDAGKFKDVKLEQRVGVTPVENTPENNKLIAYDLNGGGNFSKVADRVSPEVAVEEVHKRGAAPEA